MWNLLVPLALFIDTLSYDIDVDVIMYNQQFVCVIYQCFCLCCLVCFWYIYTLVLVTLVILCHLIPLWPLSIASCSCMMYSLLVKFFCRVLYMPGESKIIWTSRMLR